MGLSQRIALSAIAARPGVFNDRFAAWVDENWHIWSDFERRANEIARFRSHYGARRIVEAMRHDSAIREQGDGWKINGNYVGDMSRLYMVLHPAHVGLFETRSSHLRAA